MAGGDAGVWLGVAHERDVMRREARAEWWQRASERRVAVAAVEMLGWKERERRGGEEGAVWARIESR